MTPQSKPLQLKFRDWFDTKDDPVKEVADKWFREDGIAKYRTPTKVLIADTMKTYKLGLDEAAKLLERAILYYGNRHVVGGPEAYWSLVARLKNEMVGTDVAGINSCAPTADYQVWGACSDKKKRRKRGKGKR